MKRLFLAVGLCFLSAVGIAQADSDDALMRLLSNVPGDAQGPVLLIDIAAVHRQIAPLAESIAEPTRTLVPYAVFHSGPTGFDMSSFALFAEHGARAELGFSIFEIAQMAGWGEPPATPVILAGIAENGDSLEAALQARGFETTEYNGHPVWHRGRDHEISFDNREEDPFGLRFSSSQRFSLDGDRLVFSRGWDTMHGILDADSSLAEDPDAAAILQAGYTLEGAGDLIDATLLPGQPEAPPGTTPNLPPLQRYGLLHWQDSATMTGAIVIPYADVATAETAGEILGQRLDTLEAPSVKRPLLDILPWPRRIEIVETSGLAVLIFGFESRADTSQPVNLRTFMQNPRRRLMEMVETRDLDVLVGR